MSAVLTAPPHPPLLATPGLGPAPLTVTVTLPSAGPRTDRAVVALVAAGACPSADRAAAPPDRLAPHGVSVPSPCPCANCRADARRSAASDRSVAPPRYDLVATRAEAEALVGHLAAIGVTFSITRHGLTVPGGAGPVRP